MLTLGECRTDRGLIAVCNVDPTSQAFTDYVNSASRMLLRRGNWWDTVQPISITVTSASIVWPRYVQSVLGIVWEQEVIRPVNRWYSFIPMDPTVRSLVKAYRLHGYSGSIAIEQDKTLPVFNPIADDSAAAILFTIDQVADKGKTITVLGLDANGDVLRTTRDDGTVQEGELVTLDYPTAVTANTFSRIDRILKQVTVGTVTATQVLTDGTTADMGFYEPGEISPEYLHTRILHLPVGYTFTTHTVEALVKLKFIPAAFDQDLVLPDNLEAIKLAIQGIKEGESGNRDMKLANEADAIRELNLQLQENFPDDEIPVNRDPFRGIGIGRQRSY